ncbi:MAG TPA: penicillin acylase family protein [Thermoanaerobaculia bacterium]|nr:penicillin acylase family protein [Thermoanaerobaculia bacterium]
MRRSAALVLLMLFVLPLSALAAPPPEDSLAAPLQVLGLFDTVRVRRDVHDIPHIFAKNDRDALFALGWVHSQDRFFQMDLLRRTFSGTLAELVGEDALDSDVEVRTLGLRRAAEASLPALSRSTQVWLESYARGVNAWLADPGNSLPAEYGPLELTRASVPAWTPVDSLVITKGLAFSLSFDLTDIDLTVALSAFQEAGEDGGFNGVALFSQDVYRAAPFDPTVSIPGRRLREPRASSAPAYLGRAARLARLYRERARAVPLLRQALEHKRDRGSNWWIASGRLTETGRPLLANDPHLGLDTPSIFYEAQLRVVPGHTEPMNAFGVTFPGVPVIVLGCNTRICWGATTNPMDVTDVYLERLVLGPGGVPTGVVFGGQTRPVALIPQAFRVNTPGDTASDNLEDAGIGPLEGGLTLVVPHRNNAPIVQVDLSEPADAFALSVQYTGWGATREMDAFRIWNRAGTLAEFQQGLQFFDVGSQNWAYADVDGNIAYWTSAEMPLREDLQNLERADGGVPPFLIRDGTHTLRHEWLPLTNPQPGQAIPFAILPQAEMPSVINPGRGWVANANNDPIGTSNDNNPLNQERRGGQGILYLGISYDRGYRIGQIERLLEAELARDGKFSVEDFERIQANNQLLDAQVFVPHILQAFQRARVASATSALGALGRDAGIVEAVERLGAWDFSTPTGIHAGYDPFDDPFDLPEPTPAEIRNSVAATIYSVWRGQVVQRVIDGTLARVGLGDFDPDGDVALADLRHLLENFSRNQGRGASGIQFFTDPDAANPSQARDLALLESLDAALGLLAGPAFAPAFESSTDQDDYRWGMLHRIVFDHPLGDPFNIPPRGGPEHLAPDLLGVSRSGGFGAVDASGHNVRADSVNEFMFGSGPARRFIGEMKPEGPVAEEVIPGGQSGVPGSPFQVDQLFLWLTNQYHPWPYRPADVADATVREE